jgi:hypothetical protein
LVLIFTKIIFSIFSLSEILYLKENYFFLYNKNIVEDLNHELEKIFTDYIKSLNKLMIYFNSIFILFGIDVFTFVLSFQIEQIIVLSNETEWIFLIPMTLVWFISLFFFYKIIRIKNDLNSKFRKVIKNYRKCIKQSENIFNNLMWRYKSQNAETFQKLLLCFILFYLPIFLRYHFLTSISREETFKYSGLLILCWAYCSHFYDFCKIKIKKGISKIKVYQIISVTDSNLFDKAVKLKREARQQ